MNASTRSTSAAGFSFEADVSVLALTNRALDVPRANGRASPTSGAVDQLDHATAKSVGVEYHIEYSEIADRVIVDYTPPEAVRAAGRPKSGGQNPSIWAAVQRIHMASDAAYPELTLWSGRVIRADVGAFESRVAGKRTSDVAKFADATRSQRAKVLRSKIAPFLRSRAVGSRTNLGLESTATGDTTRMLPQEWTRANDDIDVVRRRSLAIPPERGGQSISVALEVRNAKVVGRLSPLP